MMMMRLFTVPRLYIYCMRSRVRSLGITHSLTPLLYPSENANYALPEPNKRHSPMPRPIQHYNPHNQRSRKHRLMEEKNTEIERENRRLYEKIRKIKIKNAYQSESNLEQGTEVPDQRGTSHNMSINRPIELPKVDNNHNSLGSTRSELKSILSDRKTFVSKYFEELASMRDKMPKSTEELAQFVCNGWKVKVLLVDRQYLLLRGRKHGGKELTKKYLYSRVRHKMEVNMEDWVRMKFEFEDEDN